MSEAEDPIRRDLMASAAACLEHIRAVKWGLATSQYMTVDRGFEIHVSIQVSCHSAKKEP
jgi:hypothetical protein